MNTEVFDLGKIGITLGGEYDNKVIYEKLTIVLYKGKSYISTKTTQGVSPEQDMIVWQLVAEAKDAYHMLVDAGKTTLTEEEFLEQLVDATKGRYVVQGNIVNAADEEDLTVEHSDLLGIDVLKFKDKKYDPLTYNGMGRVILRKNLINGVNTLTQSMINKSNTIYIIQYDFTLSENITVPANCVLKFDGGSILGAYTLTLNKTYIQDNAQFDCTLAGDVTNELFNVLWMKGSDLGEQINKAGDNFKSLIVPQGSYTYNTPVVLTNIKQLFSYATLQYNGTYKNCEGIFLINGCNMGYIYFNSLSPTASLDYTDGRTINAVGLEIRNSNVNKFIINKVSRFNENIRISAYAASCSDNIWFLGYIFNGNFNIRIYQQDGGLCNEQTFIGGYIRHVDLNTTYGREYNLGIGGPAIDLDSYLPTKPADSYNKVNALRFMDIDMETALSATFLVQNAHNVSFQRCRFEGTTKKSKVLGYLKIDEYEKLYDDLLPLIDVSQATNKTLTFIPIEGYNFSICLSRERRALNGEYVPYGMILANPNGISNTSRTGYNTMKGCIVDTSSAKIVRVRALNNVRFVIQYWDSDNQNITSSYSAKQYAPGGMYFSDSINGWNSWIATDDANEKVFYIPSEITRIFIGIRTDETEVGFTNELTITTLTSVAVTVTRPATKGATSERPVGGLPATVPYFDTTLGKPIWYKGSNVWIDATGAIV